MAKSKKLLITVKEEQEKHAKEMSVKLLGKQTVSGYYSFLIQEDMNKRKERKEWKVETKSRNKI